jgi:hypothetical protein
VTVAAAPPSSPSPSPTTTVTPAPAAGGSGEGLADTGPDVRVVLSAVLGALLLITGSGLVCYGRRGPYRA